LRNTRILTVASPAYIARHGGHPAYPSELAGHDCIDFYDAANGRPYEWEFRRDSEALPVTLGSRLMVSDVEAMIGACETGVGIAQILQLGTHELIKRGG
jgi:DNA-binding transcriptional LysR family regulator